MGERAGAALDRHGRVAAAARGCVGTRFRLHGREPATGLDCVGVAAFALRSAGWAGVVPSGYALRGGDPDRVAALLDRALVRDDGVGAVLLLSVGAGQLHLAVRVEGGVVHADAGLRRVVERPGMLDWPVLGAWRMGED